MRAYDVRARDTRSRAHPPPLALHPNHVPWAQAHRMLYAHAHTGSHTATISSARDYIGMVLMQHATAGSPGFFCLRAVEQPAPAASSMLWRCPKPPSPAMGAAHMWRELHALNSSLHRTSDGATLFADVRFASCRPALFSFLIRTPVGGACGGHVASDSAALAGRREMFRCQRAG